MSAELINRGSLIKLKELIGCSRCRYADTWSEEDECICHHPNGWRPLWGMLRCANQRMPIPKNAW
jgi:hypothetical protein